MTTFTEIRNKFNNFIETDNGFDELDQIITSDNVNLVNHNNTSLLMKVFWDEVTTKNHIKVVKMLIEKGANINHKNIVNYTVVLWYCYNCNNEESERDIELFKSLIDEETDLKPTFDNKNIIQWIDEIKYITNKNEWFYAIYTKCKTKMDIFKEYLSDENYNEFSKYVNQQTQNSNEVIKKPLTFNDIWNKIDYFIKTGDGFDELTQMITSDNVNLINEYNTSLLLYVFCNGITTKNHIKVAKMLIEKGANINYKIDKHHTAVLWYCYNCQFEETERDLELFKSLINKETDLKLIYHNKNIIQFINLNDYITNKNEWFYAIYTKCKTEMNIFKEYLSEENYNEFEQFVKEKKPLTFDEVWDKIKYYIQTGYGFDELNQIITPDNVNLVNNLKNSLLMNVFRDIITTKNHIKIAKMLISRDVDINHNNWSNNNTVLWYCNNCKYKETVRDLELFKLLIISETDLKLIFCNKNIIQFINLNEYITNKNEWFYVIYTKCKTEMGIFKEYLSEENYNKFEKFVKEKDKSDKSDKSEFDLGNLVKDKDDKNEEKKKQLTKNTAYIKHKNEKLESEIKELKSKINENKNEIEKNKQLILTNEKELEKCNNYSAKNEVLETIAKFLSEDDLLQLLKSKYKK